MQFHSPIRKTTIWRNETTIRLTLFLVLLALASLPLTGMADPNKYDICHFPPDNPGNRNILTVSANSLPDHLSHGDNLLGPEICDLIDNDCDGAVDEDASGNPLTNPTTCGVGECSANTGFETCVAGQFVNDTCDPFNGATDEVCDTLDNDCDGAVDEDASGNPLTQETTCGVGECAGNTGIETCTAGAYGGDTCNPYDGSSPETCDGLDNDCDAATDEDGALLCSDGVSCTADSCNAGSCTNPPIDDFCDEWAVCDSTLGCIPDPSLTCPCDSDLEAVYWDDGSYYPFGGCVSNDGDGYPWYGLVRTLPTAPQTTHFIMDADDVEPDGVVDFTCMAGFDDDGLDGNPVQWRPTRQILTEDELWGCAIRMNPSAPQNVVGCLTE